VSYGTAGSGPSYFKVWTKAGLVMEFGYTADSKIEAQGKTAARVWALNKTSDTKGNFFSVSYTEDNANGEYRPDRIDYTGNGATSPANSVRFVYETRPDITPIYQAGSLVKTTKRLTKVQGWQGGNLVRDTTLGYSSDVLKSKVEAISTCTPSAGCLASTTFAWSAGTSGYAEASVQPHSPSGPFVGQGAFETYPIDYDGDGRTDILQIHTAAHWAHVLRPNGDGTYTEVHLQPHSPSGPFVGHSAFETYPIDYDGDGRTDILQIHKSAHWAHVLRSNGDGTYTEVHLQPHSPSGPFVGQSAFETYPIDYDGDGRTDILQIHKTAHWAHVLRSNGNGTYTEVHLQSASPSGPIFGNGSMETYPIDYDGDGRTDILQIHATAHWAQVLRSNGDGSYTRVLEQPASPSGPIFGNGSMETRLIDYNGDGLTDILQIHRTAHWAQVLSSNGDGTYTQVHLQPASPSGPIFGNGSMETYPIDYDRDGLTDILQVHKTAHWAQVLRSNGNGSYTQVHLQSTSPTGPILGNGSMETYPVDHDGDGRTDIIQISKTDHSARSLKRSGIIESELVTIVTGAQTLTSIARSHLSDFSVYSKDPLGPACAYPCTEMAGGMQVVREVKSSNGLGGNYISTYRYAGAKADQHGRGFLGFRQMTVKDEQTGVEQVTSYRQDYPFTGLVASREKKLVAQLLNRSSNSYAATDLGGTRRYPFLTQSLEESWELTGAALPAVTTAYQYDSFGNATQVGVSTGDGHAKTTVNTYSNDNTSWLLGRLTRSAVTSTTPGN
jgi:hypothetical protein